MNRVLYCTYRDIMNSIRNYYTLYRKIEKFRLNLDNAKLPDRIHEVAITHLKKANKTTPF